MIPSPCGEGSLATTSISSLLSSMITCERSPDSIPRRFGPTSLHRGPIPGLATSRHEPEGDEVYESFDPPWNDEPAPSGARRSSSSSAERNQRKAKDRKCR